MSYADFMNLSSISMLAGAVWKARKQGTVDRIIVYEIACMQWDLCVFCLLLLLLLFRKEKKKSLPVSCGLLAVGCL